jgi:hypothetical protein
MMAFEKLKDSLSALVVSILVGFVAAIAGAVSTIFIGAKLFSDEWSYGFPLAFGLPAGTVIGVLVFVLIYRKLRLTLLIDAPTYQPV